MGLTSIHHPDVLHHFSEVTNCLWCGKEGQNEGTIVNHLQMMHYKIGLVCKKYFSAPQSHLRPFSTMAGRAASHPPKEALLSHLHQPNHKHMALWIDISKMELRIRRRIEHLWDCHIRIPPPKNVELDGGSDRETASCQTNLCMSSQSSYTLPRFQ